MTEHESTPQGTRPGRRFTVSDVAWTDWRDIRFPDPVDIDLRRARSEICVNGSNLAVTYSIEEADSYPPQEGIIPGRLTCELRSVSGRTIDSIVLTRFTPLSFGQTLDELLEIGETSSAPRRDLPFLPPARLVKLLETAGSLGVSFESKLGVTPEEIGRRYVEKLRARSSEDESRERILRANDPVVTTAIVPHGFELARTLGILKVLMQGHGTLITHDVSRYRRDEKIIWMIDPSDEGLWIPEGDMRATLATSVPATSDTQIQLALFSAILAGQLKLDQRVLCLLGSEDSENLDRIDVLVPGRKFPWLSQSGLDALQSFPASTVLARVIDLSLRFATEGIEGDKIGAAFVIGDLEELAPHTKQKLLNPFLGHSSATSN